MITLFREIRSRSACLLLLALFSLFTSSVWAQVTPKYSVKPAASDAVQYVSVNGNDANDGFSRGSAKATIPAAQSALPSHGGKIDATGLGQSTYTISSTLTIGGSNVNINLILSRNTTFNCTITNNTPCVVLLAGSDIQAVGTAAYPNAGITTSASASVSDVFLDQNNISANQVGGYVDGLFVTAPVGAVVSDAICAAQNVLQVTLWRNIVCASTGAQNTVVLKIYSTGGTNIVGNPLFENVSADGEGNVGVRPVWIGCAASGSLTPVSCPIINNVNFFGGIAAHPGTGGLPIVTVEASNGAGGLNAIDGVEFHGFQIESSNTADVGILDDGANSLHVFGLVATCRTNCGTDLIKLAQPAGTTLDGVEISGYDNQGGWTHAVNNTVLTKTITPARGSYFYTKSTSETNAFVWDNGSGNDLTADPTGIKVGNQVSSPVFVSSAANPATSGCVLCLAKTDAISWRNNANSANLALGINGSDQAIFNGIVLVDLSSAQTLTNKTLTSPAIASISNTGTLTLPTATGTLAETNQLALSGTFSTTAATSDAFTITGLTASSHCSFSAANVSAATNIATSFISAQGTNSVTLTHTATSGMSYTFVCTVN